MIETTLPRRRLSPRWSPRRSSGVDMHGFKRFGNAMLALMIVATAGCGAYQPPAATAAAAPRFVDLTHDLSEDSIFWPTGQRFRLDKVADGVTDKGYYYASNNYSGNEHGGTHIDAPVHFAQGRWTV